MAVNQPFGFTRQMKCYSRHSRTCLGGGVRKAAVALTREIWEDFEEEELEMDFVMVHMSLNVHIPSCGDRVLQR